MACKLDFTDLPPTTKLGNDGPENDASAALIIPTSLVEYITPHSKLFHTDKQNPQTGEVAAISLCVIIIIIREEYR